MGNSGFKLPFISPLAGSTISNLIKVLKGNQVAPRYYFKLLITFVFSGIASALSFVDRWFFHTKVANYSIKDSPLFVIGFWRSGTTFMHHLLSMDPAAGFVSTYHALFPSNLKSKWLFKTFLKIFIPRQRPGDLMRLSADLPQEDEYAVSNISVQSFYHFFYFPSRHSYYYQQYIRFAAKADGHVDDWKLMFRDLVIKALINTKGRRIILKNPAHTGRIPVLLDIFPNARFIFIIRNPVIVYLSCKKFFSELIPTLQLEKYDLDLIPDMILDIYEQLLKDYHTDKKLVDRNRIIEIRYEQFVEHPMATIEKIYSRLSIEYDEGTILAISAHLRGQDHEYQDQYSISKQELDYILPRIEFAMKYWSYEIPDNLKIYNSFEDKT